jgi:hypothetical protein
VRLRDYLLFPIGWLVLVGALFAATLFGLSEHTLIGGLIAILAGIVFVLVLLVGLVAWSLSKE